MKLGKIPDTVLANILRNLVDVSIIEKVDEKYMVIDPIMRRAISKL